MNAKQSSINHIADICYYDRIISLAINPDAHTYK